MHLSRFYCVLLLLSFYFLHLKAQNEGYISESGIQDSIFILPDVDVTAGIQPRFRWQTPGSIGIIQQKEIENQSVVSMVSVMNTVSGVRMEERSPGSYRLSIRGSLVRSPYGVRNVKVYYNDFSLTDAGGNTYLNAINVNDLAAIEVSKGPDGSMYGANSGGIVFLRTEANQLPCLHVKAYSGSRGLVGNSFHLFRNVKKHSISVRQSWQRSDGYRQNTRNHRLFLQLSDTWQYKPGNSLSMYAFYSDLAYRTPGGLTKEQYDENPRQARPATATLPGSIEQKTGITQRMYLGGAHHRMRFSSVLEHSLSFWVTHVDFIYPFITNYETRKEDNWGARTFLTWKGKNETWNPAVNVGLEGQRLVTDAYNYDNHQGVKGDIQAYNNIVNYQLFGFIKGKINWSDRLLIEAAVSLNHNGYHFRDTTNIRNNFDPVWMPHLALSYSFNERMVARLTVSKGYSIPTTAEIRPSDNRIYKDLQAEEGWNFEAGLRAKLADSRFVADLSCFHYLLHNGIVSQMDSIGNTFFINSGRIKQFGLEYNSTSSLLAGTHDFSFLQRIVWNTSYTFAWYRYNRYIVNNTDYSGNRVAGVPRHVLINSFRFVFLNCFDFFIQHNYTDKIALNDANTVYAGSYHLLTAQMGVSFDKKKYLPSRIWLAGDNLLNQKYSLGNDLNAAGGRYFNVAPAINFQIGLNWSL